MTRVVAAMLVGLWAVAASKPDPAPPRETTWAPTVIASRGAVRIRREGWTHFAPVQFGIPVHPGDLLDAGPSASVEVICTDLSRGRLAQGEMGGAPCKSNNAPIPTPKGYRSPLRGHDAPSGPNILVVSPRWTLVRESNPTIRWIAPAEVKRVEITLRDDRVLWTQVVDASLRSLPYPAGAPRLVPGRQYWVVVTGGGLSSSRDPLPFFEVASAPQSDAVNRQLRTVRSLGLTPDKRAVLEAKLLANLGYHAEAIERLEQVAQKLGAAAAYRLLGAAYRDVGLNGLAIEKYRQALRHSEANADPDGVAMAAEALGSLCQHFGLCENGDAKKYLTKAVTIYRSLEAEAQVERLNQQLRRLK